MPEKITRSAPRPSFGLPEPLVAIHTSPQSCCKAAKARIFTPVRESSGESRLIDQTYHFNFILGSGQVRDHFAFCTQLASKIAVYRLRRSRSFGAGKELASAICAHL